LAGVIRNLLAADVPHDDIRRALVQLLEAAGISFGSAPGGDETPAAAMAPDLIGVMRQIEPGVDRGALVGARDLRRAVRMQKTQFDRAVLELARQGRLSLHRHDYPASLSAAEREELVTDGSGSYYVGMALRRGAV
jgi:hypothetical protein